MIDGSEKRNRQLAFELENSHVCEKRSNSLSLVRLMKSSTFGIGLFLQQLKS